MTAGVRLGVDVGTVRIGVAVCDPEGLLATPLETVARGRGDLDRLADLVTEHGAVEVVVGLPVSLSGRPGPAATAVTGFAHALASRVAPVPVRTVDERWTTVDATRALAESGVRGARRRSVVDQAAAVIILQHVLDAARSSGTLPGAVLHPSPSTPKAP